MTVTHTLNAPLLTDRIGRFEDAINNCSVADVQSAAGTEWQAPGFSARLLYSIPTPRPDDVTPLPANIDNPTHDPVGIVGCVAEVDRGRTRGIGRKNGVALLGGSLSQSLVRADRSDSVSRLVSQWRRGLHRGWHLFAGHADFEPGYSAPNLGATGGARTPFASRSACHNTGRFHRHRRRPEQLCHRAGALRRWHGLAKSWHRPDRTAASNSSPDIGAELILGGRTKLHPEKSLDAGPLQLCGIDDFRCQVAFSGDGYPDDR